MAGNHNSGRKRSGADQGRAWCRMVASKKSVREMLERAADEDPNVALKLFEHGFGRAPQSLTLKPAKMQVNVNFGEGTNGHAKRIDGVTLDQELVEAVHGH